MANYPGAISSNANLYIAVNGLQTTLALACTSGDTTLTLTSTTGFPTTGLVTIDNTEVVSYTGVSGATITGCTRGADGTTAAAHLIGVTVGLTVVAAHHNLLKDEIIAIETALGVALANVFPATPTTGTGNVVLATSPVLVTPNLGTPSAVNLANATNLPNSATTATPNATASTIVSRDANVNARINHMTENFATTVTAAGTTVLTAASALNQQFTGTTTQIVTLPDATTLSVGFQFTVLNRSTGIVSVNNNGGSLQQAVPATAQTTFTATSIGTANGTWDVSTSSAAGLTAYREDYVVGTALNNYTGSATVFNLVTPYSVGAHSLVVTLDGDVQTIGASVDYQETNSTTVTFVNTLVTGQKVSFLFQTATSSGGTVNSGTAGQIAYFPATGPTVSGTNDPAAISSINTTFIGAGRNRAINGDMAIDQRHSGASVAFPTAGARYSLDMFAAFSSSPGIFTMQRLSATPPTGFQFYNRFTTTTADASPSAGSYYYGFIPFEGTRIRDFLFGTASAVTVTISFWVRSSLTGTFGASLQNGADNRSYPFTYSIISANTWEKKSVTIVGDTTGTWTFDSGLGLGLNFDFGLGSTFRGTAGSWSGSNFLGVTSAVRLISTNSATWDITGLQLEIGSIASAFEYLPYEMELEFCQRHYELGAGFRHTAQGTNGVGYAFPIQFSVQKRVAPTVVVVAGSTVNVGSTGAEAPSTNGFTFIYGCNATSGTVAVGNSDDATWTADAGL